ncbi:MAG: NERD domain-containing protein [Chloroflexi bacterium]|nr:NERD domain-containing protein [Chloroflexota bacterium]
MRSLAPTRSLARRSTRLFQIAIVVVLGGVFLCVVALLLYVIPFVVASNPGFGFYNALRTILLVVGILVALAGGGMALRAVTWKLDNNLAIRVGEQLAPRLDDRYTFIRNVSKLGLGYIDAVLIGPPGVLVFRILDIEGNLLNEGSNWVKKNRRGEYMPMMFNPSSEVLADMKGLGEYLARRGHTNLPLYGIVVFTKEPPLVVLRASNPTVPSSQLTGIVDTLASDYFAMERFDSGAAQKLVKLLTDG